MITKNLFEEVLVKPVIEGADKLLVVSGFASSAMAFHHLEEIRKAKKSIEVELIVGMTCKEGLSEVDHKGFQKIATVDYAGKFQCSYIDKNPPVHSKVYVWLKKGSPFKCFIGSANYSQNAFNIKQSRKTPAKTELQKEVLTHCEPKEGLNYFNELSAQAVYCTHSEIEDLIRIYSAKQYRRKFVDESEITKQDESEITDDIFTCVDVSLLMDNGEVHPHSGLNWAYRKKYTRKKLNEAYIQLKPKIYKGDFFPPKGTHFTVLTDDNKSLLCTRAQKRYGEAIETPRNNEELGEYFRNRLGLGYGAIVTRKDLDNYGRTNVTFCQVEDDTYTMDFSV